MNEKKNYTITYKINGIYGKVEFTRNFLDKTINEMKEIKKDLLSTNNAYRNFVKFEIDVEEYDNTSDKCYSLTEMPIDGLPEDFTIDMYYNMANLRDIQSISSKPAFMTLNTDSLRKISENTLEHLRAGLKRNGSFTNISE
jgi:hypothetical protein